MKSLHNCNKVDIILKNLILLFIIHQLSNDFHELLAKR